LARVEQLPVDLTVFLLYVSSSIPLCVRQCNNMPLFFLFFRFSFVTNIFYNWSCKLSTNVGAAVWERKQYLYLFILAFRYIFFWIARVHTGKVLHKFNFRIKNYLERNIFDGIIIKFIRWPHIEGYFQAPQCQICGEFMKLILSIDVQLMDVIFAFGRYQMSLTIFVFVSRF
jgi:hypothetical protein